MLGVASACWRLGDMLAKGKHGMRQDMALARKWFEKALRCEDEEAELVGRCAERKAKASAWLEKNAVGPPLWEHEL